MSPPTLMRQDAVVDGRSRSVVTLLGDWSIRGGVGRNRSLSRQLSALKDRNEHVWDLSEIGELDTVGAMILWRAWRCRLPESARMKASESASFGRLAEYYPERRARPEKPRDPLVWIVALGRHFINGGRNCLAVVSLIGTLALDTFSSLTLPRWFPWRELSANIYRAGFQALPISALVGSTIGLAISYLFSLQLQRFAANTLIIPVLAIGIIREMGPLIAAILIAGRSGSAMTAQIGAMRITGEIDALSVMGVSPTYRLVLPKVIALAVATPFVVFWASIMGILGGLIGSQQVLGIGLSEFLTAMPKALVFKNLAIALLKGVTFGTLIGIIACHFGLKIRQNSESLSQETTASVVTSITVVMLVDAFYAILLSGVGL